MSFAIHTATNKVLDYHPEFLQAGNSSGQTNQTIAASPFTTYSIITTSLTSPFILIFGGLFIFTLVSFILQRKHLKRNQVVLFVLLLTLEITCMISNGTRASSELSLMAGRDAQGKLNKGYYGIKAVDRFLVSVLIFIQILIMSFICYVFMATTRQIGYVTKNMYNISKIVLVILVTIIGTILILNNIAILTYHGLMADTNILIESGTEYSFMVSIFIAPCVIFFFACITISIFINVSYHITVFSLSNEIYQVYGYTLYSSLKKSQKNLKLTFDQQNSLIKDDEQADQSEVTSSIVIENSRISKILSMEESIGTSGFGLEKDSSSPALAPCNSSLVAVQQLEKTSLSLSSSMEGFSNSREALNVSNQKGDSSVSSFVSSPPNEDSEYVYPNSPLSPTNSLPCDHRNSIQERVQSPTPSESKSKSMKNYSTFTKEQESAYMVKKRALQKALALQIGLSLCLLLEAIGVFFISIGVIWNYSVVIFFMLFNIGIVAFISLLIGIYHPLRQVQQLFRMPSDKKIVEMKSLPMTAETRKRGVSETI